MPISAATALIVLIGALVLVGLFAAQRRGWMGGGAAVGIAAIIIFLLIVLFLYPSPFLPGG